MHFVLLVSLRRAQYKPLCLIEFDCILEHITVCPIGVDPFGYGLQRLAQDNCVAVDHNAGDDGLVPFILQIHLGHRDVELAAQTRHQRLDTSTLFFERGTAGEQEVQGEGGEHEILVLVKSKRLMESPRFVVLKDYQTR